MKSHIKILSITLMLTLSSSAFSEGIFSNSLQGCVATSSMDVPSASSIFRKHLGAPNPVRWARQLPGVANSETFLSSDAWLTTRADFLRTYGNTANVNQYLNYQEYLFRRAIRINNKASFRSSDIKGNLAESLMDYFYQKDGWEVLDGKRGRNGFDGLYVQRNKNGIIFKWLVVEAKSGSSRPRMTNRGMQLSPGWIDGNLKDLLINAEDEYRQNQSLIARQRVEDLKQIIKLPGRQGRFFRMRLEQHDGKVLCKISNLDINGNPIGKPMLVNMNSANSGKMLIMERLIFKNLEKHISFYDPLGAAKLANKIQIALKKGLIKSDSDLYQFIKREIPDRKLAAAIAQELGERPPRGSLAGAIGKQISKNSGMILSATVVAGFIIAHDAMRDGITSETFIKAGVASVATLGVGLAIDYSMNILVTQSSRIAARYILERTGKRITERAVSRLAAELAPSLAKGLGGGLQIVFGAIYIGNAIYDYSIGNMTQTDMLVNVSIVALTTAGAVFFTCTEGGAKVGALIGSLFGPVGTAAGGAIGTGIGIGIGIIGGLATGGYTWYVENRRQENVLYETRHRAEWETKNNRERLETTIRELEQKFMQMRDEAWRGLVQAF